VFPAKAKFNCAIVSRLMLWAAQYLRASCFLEEGGRKYSGNRKIFVEARDLEADQETPGGFKLPG
jgi:hypothetical protein